MAYLKLSFGSERSPKLQQAVGEEQPERALAATVEKMNSPRCLSSPSGRLDGHLRHSSFAGLRDDKDPLLIVRESALAERNPMNPSLLRGCYLHRLILSQLQGFQPRLQHSNLCLLLF